MDVLNYDKLSGSNVFEILIVDDSKVNLELISDVLNYRSYKITPALNGQRALNLCKEHSFDLILLDIIMPLMDGFEVCAKLKANEGTASIPIIFLTAKNDEESIVKGLNAGAVDFITKPFNEAELKARVKIHIALQHSKAMIQKELYHRKIAEEKLRVAYSEIEKVVEKRTKELKEEIKERKQTEKALIESEFMLKEAQQIAKIGNWNYNIGQKHLYISEAVAQLLGLAGENTSLSIEKYKTFIHHDDLDFFQETILKALKGEKCKIDYRILTSNDETKYLEHRIRIKPNESGEIVQLYGTVMDITDRKVAEENLKIQQVEVENAYLMLSEQNIQIELQKNQLQDLNATKDKFFSIIAHDLKNPFQHILGFSELLENEFDTIDYDDKKRYVSYIYKSSKQVYDLLQNLLEWSRTQTGRIKFVPTRIDIKQLIDRCIELLSNNAQSKEIKLFSALMQSIFIEADEEMLMAIIRNLISNAIKFTPRGGKVYINAFQNTGSVEVSVNDTGVGISDENINLLFKLDESYTTKGTEEESGSGLGLILCKEFTEKHGGEIGVKSTPGKGSTFTFTLPKKIEIEDEEEPLNDEPMYF